MKRIFLFLLTNLAVMLVLSIVLSLVYSFTGISPGSMSGLLILAAVFGFGGAFISLLMSKKMALASVGGQVIESPRNEMEHWLLSTVEAQAKQLGIGMPSVALYDAPEMNAFATGAKRDDSLVAVSTGLMHSMSRDEAEAVLAHEMSHIANGDMVTMTLMQGVVNTFVIFLARVVAGIVSGSRDEESGEVQGGMAYYLTSFVLELLFGFLASFITMWYSRRREFYADAGAAQLVGKEKMIAALERLSHGMEPQLEGSMKAFGINGGGASLSDLLRTHPQISDRIQALKDDAYAGQSGITVAA